MIHAMRAQGTENDPVVQPLLFQELQAGKAHFGWSYGPEADLRAKQGRRPAANSRSFV